MSDFDSDVELELVDNLTDLISNSASSSSSKFKGKNLKEQRPNPYTTMTTNGQVTNQVTAPSLMPIQISELTALTNTLPEFYPGGNLSTFVNAVDNLIKFLDKKLTLSQVYLFNVSVLAKVKNEARDYLNFHNETEWSGIRSALLRKYGDQRNEEILLSALRSTVQKQNESYLEYYDRVLLAQNDLMQYVQLHETDQNIIAFKRHFYQKQTLQVFCSGLNDPYHEYLMHFDLVSLEEALNKCRIYDNKIQEHKYMKYLRNSNDKHRPNVQKNNQPARNTFSGPSFAFNPRPPQMQNIPPMRYLQPQTNNQQKTFAGSVNKPIPQSSRLPMNKQNFGTKPGSAMSRNTFKPTPMSVQTSVPNNFRQNNNIFQSTSRPTFVSEELFNNEVDVETNEIPMYSEINYEEQYMETPQNEAENFHVTASDECQI